MGPDGVHPYFLKSCISSVVYPLLLIFICLLEVGSLPTVWKQSTVVPIYKKGSRFDPLMYRPISLTSTCVKTMERILSKHMYDYMETNHLFNYSQYGFRPGRSTEDQMLSAYNDITQWLDEGFACNLILFYFSKALDVVNHNNSNI